MADVPKGDWDSYNRNSKGDLHDIGKNLVKIMMESKNIRVIDLGVDVSPRRFLEEAVGSHAQIVCLSGIMPHSEEDMRAVVEEFEMKGIRSVLFYGRWLFSDGEAGKGNRCRLLYGRCL